MIDHQEQGEVEITTGRQESLLGAQVEQTKHWIDGTYRPGITKLLQQRGLERDIKLADLSSQLAITLFPISRELNVARKHDKELTEALGKIGPELAGPVSILTLADLILGCRPELKGSLTSLEGIVTPGEVDVKSKVDLVFDFNTRDRNGRKIIHLVQLKSIRESNVHVVRIHPGDEKNYFETVSKQDARKILRYAEQLGRKKNAVVRSYVMLVPAYDTSAVGNIYGIIQKDRTSLLALFNEEATREGFFPQRKKESQYEQQQRKRREITH